MVHSQNYTACVIHRDKTFVDYLYHDICVSLSIYGQKFHNKKMVNFIMPLSLNQTLKLKLVICLECS